MIGSVLEVCLEVKFIDLSDFKKENNKLGNYESPKSVQ